MEEQQLTIISFAYDYIYYVNKNRRNHDEKFTDLCWLKAFLLEPFFCLRACVGRARGIFCSWTTRLSPFFSPPISFVKVAAYEEEEEEEEQEK